MNYEWEKVGENRYEMDSDNFSVTLELESDKTFSWEVEPKSSLRIDSGYYCDDVDEALAEIDNVLTELRIKLDSLSTCMFREKNTLEFVGNSDSLAGYREARRKKRKSHRLAVRRAKTALSKSGSLKRLDTFEKLDVAFHRRTYGAKPKQKRLVWLICNVVRTTRT